MRPFRAVRPLPALLVSILALAAVARLVLAAGASPGPACAAEVIAPGEIGDVVRILADPLLRGRDAGSPGARLAAEMIRARFRMVGLVSPEGADDYFQPVPLLRLRFDAPGTRVVLRAPGGTEASLRNLERAFVRLRGPLPLEAKGRTLPLVFAGYGIRAPERGFDEYAGLDVRGRAVVVLAGEPRGENGRPRLGGRRFSRYGLVSSKVKAAEEAGAVMLVVVPSPRGRSLAQLVARKRASFEEPVVVLDDGEPRVPVVHVDGEAGRALLAAAGVDLAEALARLDRMEPVSRPLADGGIRLEVAGLATERFVDPNVVGLLPGTDPEVGQDLVIVGAHYDHIGVGVDEAGREVVFPGADDNASGVAGMLAAARVLAAGPRPRRSILFLGFAAEEKGALGAAWWTRHQAPAGRKLAAMIDLDMIGRDHRDDAAYRHAILATFTGRCPLFMELLPDLGRRAGIEVRRIPYLRSIGRSDDALFAARGVPSVMFFSGMYADHDTPRDTADRLDTGKAGAVARLTVLLARELANHGGPLPWDVNMKAAPPADPWDPPY